MPFRITMTMTPPLLGMLRDELLHVALCSAPRQALRAGRQGGRAHLRRRDAGAAGLAQPRATTTTCAASSTIATGAIWSAAFRRLQDAGLLEIITCGATHGFLPLMIHTGGAARADASRRRPLPDELRPRPARHLAARMRLLPRPRQAARRREHPLLLRRHARRSTHAAAAPALRRLCAHLYPRAAWPPSRRDPSRVVQVWSAEHGYPGDPAYREFYRDIGYDLDYDYMRPYIQATGERKNIGLKYHRITGKVPLSTRSLRSRGRARTRRGARRATSSSTGERQIEHLRGCSVKARRRSWSPYDAELYGHWWFEGPDFLDAFIRKAALDQDVVQAAHARSTTSRERPSSSCAAADVGLGRGRLLRACGWTRRTTGSTATCTRRPSG